MNSKSEVAATAQAVNGWVAHPAVATNGNGATSASIVDVITVDDIPEPAAAPPAPIAPVDFEHVHRKLMRLLVSLEQTGAISSDEVHRIRAHP